MLAASSHNPLHVLSYHTNFRNTTLTTTKVDLSILTTGECTSFSGATVTIGGKESVDSSKVAMFSEHAIGSINALSSARSIVVPILSSQMESSSSSITATGRLGLTAIVVPSKWNNSSDIAVPTTTNAEPYRWMDTSPTHCVSERYHRAFSSLCSTSNRGHGDATARGNATSNLNSVQGSSNQTAWSSCTEAQGLLTSSVTSPGYDTKQPLAQATESRGWEDFPVTTTEAQSRTIPDQSLEKSQHAELDGSGIRPYDPTSDVTHLIGASFISQTSVCTSETWSRTNILNADAPSEAATNNTSATPSTTSGPPPTFASTAHMATIPCVWVLIYLGAMVVFYI